MEWGNNVRSFFCVFFNQPNLIWKDDDEEAKEEEEK